MIKSQLLELKLKSRFRYTLLIGLAGLVISTFYLIDILVNEADPSMVIFNYILMFLTAIFGLLMLYFSLECVMDLNELKKGKSPVVTVKFISFGKKYVNSKTQEVTYSNQVFLNTESNQELVLVVGSIEPQRVYKVMYGTKTKIGIALS
ncbi:Uncharacterised protein [Acholeplasma oculi]|uniref:Uncharacterized protein n=1 Tax=Acholeplasma oculi TaxID=35623 RepID=A0A061AGJ6_9MOLU|nr:hypothetical protein [Acholeplasma oculi]CDR30082.1 hypothetical protein Aocu_00090 [Acholeplasma oculi]SKC50090.1 hypothetical protein SAMN02745122_1457 [Acholeplasma oculi]SUT88315.1 Uncharacterised protein [Acholeplasma oculi]